MLHQQLQHLKKYCKCNLHDQQKRCLATDQSILSSTIGQWGAKPILPQDHFHGTTRQPHRSTDRRGKWNHSRLHRWRKTRLHFMRYTEDEQEGKVSIRYKKVTRDDVLQ